MTRQYALILLLFSLCLYSQESWKSYFDVLQDYNTRDEIKMNISKQLTDALTEQLKENPNFVFDESLPWRKVATKDSQLCVYSWHYSWQDASSLYGGVVYHKGQVIPLSYAMSPIDADDEYSALNWGGGVYYDIIPIKVKGEEKYTLLAWDGNNGVTYKKIVEVLSFDRKGFPHFGDAIFNNESRKQRRVIMEYSSDMSLLLNYNAEEDYIITNALHSTDQRFDGVEEYYSASDAFNIFRFENDLWVLYKNVDLRMNKKESRHYQDADQRKSSGL